MRNQLDVLKAELRSKKRLVSRHLNQRNADCTVDGVIVQGPPVTPAMDLPIAEPPLMITESWQRVYSLMWVTAVRVFNTSDRYEPK